MSCNLGAGRQVVLSPASLRNNLRAPLSYAGGERHAVIMPHVSIAATRFQPRRDRVLERLSEPRRPPDRGEGSLMGLPWAEPCTESVSGNRQRGAGRGNCDGEPPLGLAALATKLFPRIARASSTAVGAHCRVFLVRVSREVPSRHARCELIMRLRWEQGVDPLLTRSRLLDRRWTQVSWLHSAPAEICNGPTHARTFRGHRCLTTCGPCAKCGSVSWLCLSQAMSGMPGQVPRGLAASWRPGRPERVWSGGGALRSAERGMMGAGRSH